MATEERIPLMYQVMFNWIEPFFAFGGAVQAYFAPASLVSIATPNTPYSDRMHPFFTQIAGAWLLLVFNDLVTLRLTNDRRIWASILTAGLLSDVAYTLSLIEDMGLGAFLNPLKWNSANWTTMLTTLPPLAFKLLFLAGVGFRHPLSPSSTSKSKTN